MQYSCSCNSCRDCKCELRYCFSETVGWVTERASGLKKFLHQKSPKLPLQIYNGPSLVRSDLWVIQKFIFKVAIVVVVVVLVVVVVVVGTYLLYFRLLKSCSTNARLRQYTV